MFELHLGLSALCFAKGLCISSRYQVTTPRTAQGASPIWLLYIRAWKEKDTIRAFSKAYADDEVTPQAIKDAKAMLSDAKPEDTLVLFIAGHGVHDNDKNRTYSILPMVLIENIFLPLLPILTPLKTSSKTSRHVRSCF